MSKISIRVYKEDTSSNLEVNLKDSSVTVHDLILLLSASEFVEFNEGGSAECAAVCVRGETLAVIKEEGFKVSSSAESVYIASFGENTVFSLIFMSKYDQVSRMKNMKCDKELISFLGEV